MSRSWWRRRLALPALVPAAALAILMVGVIPAHAVVSNPALGALDPAAPGSNQYSGCVAAALTGDGFVFGSSATIGTELAALWPNLPSGLTSACRQAVLTAQPQVCVNPAEPNLCPAVGAAAEGQLA